MFGWLRSLFGRDKKREASPIREEDAYARSYGERSGEIVSVSRIELKPIPRRTGDMSGELLRRAFEQRLDARGKAAGDKAVTRPPTQNGAQESGLRADPPEVRGSEFPRTRVAASARAGQDSPLAS
jgi:hypothetical protein